jgi:hypothetical protein
MLGEVNEASEALLDIGKMFLGEFGPLLGLQVIVKKDGERDRTWHPFQVFNIKLSSMPNGLFERFEPLCAFSGQDPQFLRNCQRVFAFFSDPLIPFLQFLLGFRFACEKKTPSLSVDLEPIEVILVIPVAFVGEYAQESARHAPLLRIFFQILATIGNKRRRLGWPRGIEKASESSLEAERGGMVERFNAPVLKTGDPQGSVGSNPTPSAIVDYKQLTED